MTSKNELDVIEQELADHAITNQEVVPGLRDRPDKWHEEPNEGPERENLESDIDDLRAAQKEAGLLDRDNEELLDNLERAIARGGSPMIIPNPAPQKVQLVDSEDPFDITNAPGQNLIVLMRIYDVLMGIYSESAPDKATALIEMHNSGKLLLDFPKLIV